MRGGDRIISTKLIFTRNMAALGKGDFGIDTDFYEANINVDAILGCPWMKRNRLGIFPYLEALSLEREGGQLDLLKDSTPRRNRHGWRRHRKSKRRKEVGIIGAHEIDEGEMKGWLQHLKLEIPNLSQDGASCMLSENEHNIVREKILAHDAKFVQTVIIAKGDCADEDPRVEQFREEIHREYDGIVLRKEFIPNPPIRGPDGQAFIPLKEGTVPQRQKPFRQHGEKEQALITIVKQWLEAGLIEKATDPRNEWLSQAFAVLKNLQLFPGEGL